MHSDKTIKMMFASSKKKKKVDPSCIRQCFRFKAKTPALLLIGKYQRRPLPHRILTKDLCKNRVFKNLFAVVLIDNKCYHRAFGSTFLQSKSYYI